MDSSSFGFLINFILKEKNLWKMLFKWHISLYSKCLSYLSFIHIFTQAILKWPAHISWGDGVRGEWNNERSPGAHHGLNDQQEESGRRREPNQSPYLISRFGLKVAS